MLPNFNRIVQISQALFEKGATGRCFHTSFILKKGRILSIGINNYCKTHPRIRNFNYHPGAKLHSELAATLKLGLTDCSGLSIVNIRINKRGELKNSLFCSGCSQIVRALNFKEAYYTNDSGQFEEYFI